MMHPKEIFPPQPQMGHILGGFTRFQRKKERVFLRFLILRNRYSSLVGSIRTVPVGEKNGFFKQGGWGDVILLTFFSRNNDPNSVFFGGVEG